MTDPLKTQEGGNHYKGMVIQPFELSMANNYDALTHTVIKYVHRHADKGGAEDLRKAIHCVELRKLLATVTPLALSVIPIETYIRENGILGPEATVIKKTHLLAIGGAVAHRDIIHHIIKLIELRYPNAV